MFLVLLATRTLHVTSTTISTPSATTIRASNNDPTTMLARETGDSSSDRGAPEAEILRVAVASSSICSAIATQEQRQGEYVAMTGIADHESPVLA